MPLLESGEVEWDRTLAQQIADSYFIDSDSLIWDRHGNQWMVWRVGELEQWWLAFERIAGGSLSRKLLHSATDEEEYQLNSSGILETGMFFKKSKQIQTLDNRWSLNGWGRFDAKKNLVHLPILSAISSGLAHARVESMQGRRFTNQWSQPSNELLSLSLEPDVKVISPAKKFSLFPWNAQQNTGTPLQLMPISSSGTWSLSGERACLIPAAIINRVMKYVRKDAVQLAREDFDSWTVSGCSEFESAALICAAHACIDMVEFSELPVYIENSQQWIDYISNTISLNGWGRIQSVKDGDTPDSIIVLVKNSQTLPIFTGMLCALWQRSCGKKAKVTVERQGDDWQISIESRHSYSA